MQHFNHAHIFDDFRAARLRAFGQGEGDFFWNHFSVVGQPSRAEHVVNAEQRPFFFGRPGADQLHLDPEPLRHGSRAAQLRQTVLGPRDDEAADFFPADGMAGFLFQTRIKFGAVFIDPGHAVGSAEAANQSGGVPRRAAGQLVLFQQHDVLPSEFGEMIGNAAPDDATADDDDFGFGGRRNVHNRERILRTRRFSTMPGFGE